MEQENSAPGGNNKIFEKISVVLGVILILAIVGFIFAGKYKKDKFANDNRGITAEEKQSSTEEENSAKNIPVALSEKIEKSKFGFLSGGEEDTFFLFAVGAGWGRPHPGPFLWDSMQKSKESVIDFSRTDKAASSYGKNDLGILATIWPFADWDQAENPKQTECAVNTNDEFLLKNDEKGRGGDYLPTYRCAPVDLAAYLNWVKAVVERYDGDGQDDMPGLKVPIKYWEVSNEPDLTPGPDGRLIFWKDTPEKYAQLLIETYQAIKETDPEANVLIAGAAGADETFLGFYKKVLADEKAGKSFDIANIHCISNDKGAGDFNVGAYKKMLENLAISKPIWVTEAESFNGKTAEENYALTKASTEKALSLGAEKIFFTRYNFDDFRQDMSENNMPSEASMQDSENKYRFLIENNQ